MSNRRVKDLINEDDNCQQHVEGWVERMMDWRSRQVEKRKQKYALDDSTTTVL
ncbi:hypothetical protein R6Q57_022857 [Mikania cordata]